MELIHALFNIAITSFMQLLSLVGVIIIVGFILSYLQERSRIYWLRAFGTKGFLLTAWIGTPIHEFGHAFMCVIFRHQIVEIKWFPTHAASDSLGHVKHRYNPNNVYQNIGNFFIGIAPVFTGITSLMILMYYFVPASYSLVMHYMKTNIGFGHISLEIVHSVFVSSLLLLKSLFTVSNLLQPSFWLFLFLAICISTHIALSTSDIRGAFTGLVTIFIVLLLVNSGAALLHMNKHNMLATIGKYNAYILAFSSIAILFSCISVIISYIFYKIKSAFIRV